MKIVDVSIKRRVTLVMIYLIVIFFGFFALSQLKIDLYPEIDFPIVGIITNYQGVGPEDIENLVTRPIEEAVTAVKNVEEVNSQSSQGASVIMMEFSYGTDMDQAETDVRNSIDMIADYLPDDATEPLIFAFDPSMIPIQFISLSSEYLGPAELRKLSEDNIEPFIERVDGVASAATQGGLRRQINVKLNPVLLSSYNLSADNVANAVRAGSGLLPAGRIETETVNYNLRVYTEYKNIDQISNTIITYKGSEPVYVKDVAEVEDGFEESTADVRANFGQGIVIPVSKQSDANTVQVAERVRQALPEIEKRLPQGTRFHVIWDQSDFIQRSLSNLSNTGVMAFVLAFFVIYLFLRNWRGSVIMGVSIPVSVIATFAVLMLADLTLNTITMAGLALAIGMLVDNSIVVLENIYRFREEGSDLKEAAGKGSAEVAMAITASTLTTVSVFLPVLFVPGLVGQLFKDMVLTITFSLVVSLAVALSLVPMMASVILKKEKKKRKQGALDRFKNSLERGQNRLNDTFMKGLDWVLGHKLFFAIAIIVTFFASIFAGYKFLGGEFMPQPDQGIVHAYLEAPPGSPLNRTRSFVYQVEDIIREEVPEMEAVSISFGAQEGWGSFDTKSNTMELILRLKDKKERERSQSEIESVLRERFDQLPGLTYNFQQGGMQQEKAVILKIVGHDLETGRAIAEDIKEKVENIKGFVDIDINMKTSSPELRVNLNEDIINDLKLSPMAVASNISTSMQGKTVGEFREAGDEYDVYVQLGKEYREDRNALEQLLIPMPTGEMVQLKNIADIDEEVSAATIFRENQNRYVSVEMNLDQSVLDLSAAVAEIDNILDNTPIPSDYTVLIGGSAEDQQESQVYLGIAFMVAILLVYMVMAAQFESFVDPLVIIFTVPFSVIGVMMALLLTGTSLSVMALVGFVMLVGIAVNNGIVLVDYMNQLRNRGYELYDAVREASRARFRPVLMTAMTTILGMVPLAMELGSGSETWAPLARAVIGGLISTTILTLLFIPVLYIFFERLSAWTKRKVRKLFGSEPAGQKV